MEEIKQLDTINEVVNIKEVITSLTQDLNNMIDLGFDEYKKAHENLNKYRGITISEEILPEVNIALEKVQTCFAAIYPALNFINYRYQYAVQATSDYNTFIEELKKAGAKENNPTAIIQQ